MSNWQSPHNAGHPDQPGYYIDSDFVPPSSPPGAITRPTPEGFNFNEKSIRFRFIRRVYLLHMYKFLSTIAVVGFVFLHPPTSKFLTSKPALIWFAIGFMIFTIIYMFCCSSSIRHNPAVQSIFLYISTKAECFLAVVISTRYCGYECLFSFGITIVICFAFGLFVFQSKLNFTGLRTIAYVFFTGISMPGIIFICFDSQIRAIIFGSFGAMIFSFYFICDMQLMMNGKHKYLISPEDYVFATITLYPDVINIFVCYLKIIGRTYNC